MRAGLGAVGRELQGRPRAIDGAQHFCVRNVELAQPGMRGFAALALLLRLRLRRQRIAQMLRLMDERTLLRGEQQGRQ